MSRPAPPTRRVELTRLRGGWRWRYVDDGVRILGNRGFARMEEALAAIRRAYPGVRVFRYSPRPRRIRAAATAVALGAIVAGLMVARRQRTRDQQRSRR